MTIKQRPIRLVGVRQNNLRNITVEFPSRKLSVITGLSGSGKSSLAFDTLYAEGQRRYVESLSTYTRQFLEKMPKPDIDSIENIPPSIALEQKNHVLNSRSTVGTQTEIIDYLRVLFSKIGKTFCISCQGEVKQIHSQSILEWAIHSLTGRKTIIVAPLELMTQENPSTKKLQKGKAKSASQSTKQTLTPELLQSLQKTLHAYREQGYQRVLIQTKLEQFTVLEIEDLTDQILKGLPKDSRFFVVIDRLALKEPIDSETRGRLLDSIEQALTLGHHQMGFFDPSTEEPTSEKFKMFKTQFACIKCGTEHRIPEPHLFSFNSPMGACTTCSGFGYTLTLDEALVVPDPTLPLKNGAIDPFSKPAYIEWQRDLLRFAERHGISVAKRYCDLTRSQKNLLWQGDPNDSTFPGILACFEELKKWKYKLYVRVFIRRYQSQTLCPNCTGARLKKEALAVQIHGKSIIDLLESSVEDFLQWMQTIDFSQQERKIAHEVLSQVTRRLTFLQEVGVGYLTLSRLTKTLSGGEFQRINLATQLGNGLCGTLYVLDEPSIGLHAADTARLIGVLQRLRDQGNSVVVVEHDLEVMKAADWLVELGPGAGHLGGHLVAQASAQDISQMPQSVTGKYLKGELKLKRDRGPRSPAQRKLILHGCEENNLKNIRVELPLDRLVVITGVSGSGKSTLVHKTLYQHLSQILYRTSDSPGKLDKLYGAEQLGGVVLLDQSSIGKTSRSNPATYLKAWDEVRRLLAQQVLSLRRGYTPQHFSFNVDGGRCPVCKGEGEITLDMHFMAEVKLPCEECNGRRFKKTILDVQYRGKTVYEILQSTIDEAFELFRDQPTLNRKLGILKDVGLGYLRLGQSATTLSGGESQRLKIAATLDDRNAENLLYIFDEPTTGLHLEDIKKLMRVIQDLVDAKHSVIMIEHHLDVIAQADWVIDLGPGGGTHGGELIAEGTPEDLVKNPKSVTGSMLKGTLL